MTIAELPATEEIRRHVLTTWLDELYERLRAAEARVADERLTPVERKAARHTARHTARQIILAEQQLRTIRMEVFPDG